MTRGGLNSTTVSSPTPESTMTGFIGDEQLVDPGSAELPVDALILGN
jgi:hypothetical protein